MNTVTPFDTLAMTLALRDEAGFDQKQAEGTARVLSRLLATDLVTKTDLATEVQKLDARVRETELRLDAKIRESELRLEAKIEGVKADLIKWLFGTIVAQTGLIIAAIRFLGHG
jgi:hypothetical protein